MNNLPKRKPNRLSGYDYSQAGTYFVTICTYDRLHLLSKISVGDGFPIPHPTDIGNIVLRHIQLIPQKYPTAHVERYVIMPNHVHLLIMLGVVSHGTENPSPTIGSIMGWFKYQTTKSTNESHPLSWNRVWQRSYHDHIVRDEDEFYQVQLYIEQNPLAWEQDELYCCPTAPTP